MRENEFMYPQVAVDTALRLSALGILDKENARICDVSVAAIRHWRCGTRRGVIVQKYSGEFARGLFHSDGWRGVNRVRRRLNAGDRWYEYPRYVFDNQSDDILRLCGETLDRLGVAWRFSRRKTISVARREAVARLDEFVGPKY